MADLVVTGLRKSYGPVEALAGVDLTVAEGSLVAVLGPSGCGKTTLLRCVAGFERIDAGTITVAGRVVAAGGGPVGGRAGAAAGRARHVPPHRRRVAVVPQEGALFPHLPVAGNVAYGLDRAARRAGRVAEVLDLVGLSGYERRMPHELSGGQQQRVAVARALAPRPPLVLLDEPFSALDAALRADVRRDVRAALRADGATAVLVTHDRGEALSMADEVAVLRAGRIVQAGSPVQVYREPADGWVAGFLGEAVLLPARVEGGGLVFALGPVSATAAPGAPFSGAPFSGAPFSGAPWTGPVSVLIRPEQVDLLPDDGSGAAGPAGVVVRHDFHGHDSLVAVRLADGTEITARILDAAPPVGVGARVRVRLRGDVRVLPG